MMTVLSLQEIQGPWKFTVELSEMIDIPEKALSEKDIIQV